MQFYGSYVPAVNGGTSRKSTQIGRQYTGRPAPYYFNQWKTDGTLERINRELNQLDRKREKREAYPSVFCIDSQNGPPRGVKLAPMIYEYRGIDGYKKVNAGPPVRAQKAVAG